MQKVFFRNLIAFFLAFVALARSEEKFHVRKDSWGSLFLRCLFGTLGMVANFWAIDRLGLADSNILNKMSPFFAIVMSLFILRERPNKVEWTSVLIALAGAAFVIKPTAGIASLPALVGLFSGFAAGTAVRNPSHFCARPRFCVSSTIRHKSTPLPGGLPHW